MADLGKTHWLVIKWVLRYIRGIIDGGLVYNRGSNNDSVIKDFVDANYDGDLDKRRSQTQYVFTMLGNVVNWKVNFQRIVALSTTDSKYIVLIKEVIEAF